uniref:Erbin n=1 Tax=Denticeps clupeoides TaxID=299321 RepID=A0AAY4DUN1_9TELE
MTTKRSLLVRLVPCRCLRGEDETVTSLDYSHCSLEQVPKEIFGFEKSLEELYLDANQIEELPKQLFNCQSLHRLSLPDNDLSVLPAAIANLINLRELDVSKNSIQEFPENIKNCKVLTIVEASVNPISKLPEGFTQLLSLTQLYLNDAFLEFLPASFGRLTKLQILELRENQLKMLPKSMHKLTQLERLDLGSNEFTEVPEVLEQLTGIRELWMDGNRLSILPGMVGTLKQLCYLDVSKNNIETVDEQICGCENLQDLLLSNNALTQLPESIGSLRKMTALKVDDNQLLHLPDSVGGLSLLDELDCSFNEIESLPASIGQCVNLRTFAADHNFLTQLPPEMGSWNNATVLFLHSNKLEFLPEEMGDMARLRVLNLSDNKLKNLPFSFTKLTQMTAMWLSENQSKPLIPLQKDEDPETHKTVLTNYMFPQQPRNEDNVHNSDSESFNPALWEEQRKQRAQVAFECDEDKDEREAPSREGHLRRYPTPYPEELKNMVKTAQSVAHRLKEDETATDGVKERNCVGVQDVGVKVGWTTTHQIAETIERVPLKLSEDPRAMVNHDDTLEDPEDLSSEEEEMKVAQMRPPLIEISINQPKVLSLNKDKKDDSRDSDSLLDETVANSNQNNSNCSSPSHMSDSVSLTTDSSQDNSLCTPERETKMPLDYFTHRSEDKNLNQLKGVSLLPNCNGSDISLQKLLTCQQPEKMRELDLSMEEKLALIGHSLNRSDPYNKWDQMNMNLAKLSTDNSLQFEDLEQTNKGSVVLRNDNAFSSLENLENGNQLAQTPSSDYLSEHADEPSVFLLKHDGNGDIALSHSTEDLSPEKRCPPPPVTKSHSITNMETGKMKLYPIESDSGSHEHVPTGRLPMSSGHAQSIVRSKSASLLNDQPLQLHPGSSTSSSDLLSSTRPPMATIRPPPPQYNVQYSSSALPKDNLWAQRMPMPLDQGYVPSQHSLANINYSNRNNAPPYPMQPSQWAPPGTPETWTKERMLPPGVQRGTLHRQSSSSSTVSMGTHDSRCVRMPEGDYLTYREVHTMGRGPPVSQAGQRPLSARTYSIDGPNVARPQSARPLPHELPERTMSVSDFSYQQGSPGKRANVRVKSEHSLLDGPPSGGRVPADWREHVMRHIEAKKMEKIHVKMEKNPELGFSISGGVGGRGNPFHPDDNGIFVTRVQPEGPASKVLQPGDKIIKANGYSFLNIDHSNAVSLLKTLPNTVDLVVIRELSA